MRAYIFMMIAISGFYTIGMAADGNVGYAFIFAALGAYWTIALNHFDKKQAEKKQKALDEQDKTK